MIPERISTTIGREKQIENEVMDGLAKAWNQFVTLTPSHPDDQDDFRRSIHECQRIIATRNMRRIEPKIWLSYPDALV